MMRSFKILSEKENARGGDSASDAATAPLSSPAKIGATAPM
jgi:hypothetical protein